MNNFAWIKGTINPPQEDEYYVICRAKRDMVDPSTGKVLRKKGDIEIDGDHWDSEEQYWQSLGKDNPFWEVIAWADVFKPPIPECIKQNVRRYFGAECE